MRRITLALGIVTLAFASCQNNTGTDSAAASNALGDSTTVVDMHTSQISLDWHGTYVGTLPCADCSGIKTTIELKDDNTYTKHLEYLGKENGDFSESGKIEWHENGNNITLTSLDGEKQQFKVREGSLAMLNQDGGEVTGDLAEHYVLTKTN